MQKKRLALIFSGFLIWLVSDNLIYPSIIDLVFVKGYPVFIEDLYQFFLFTFLGVYVGWFEKKKGWFLAFVLGLIITTFFLLTISVTNLLEEEIQKYGYLKAMIKIICTYLLYTAYLIIGGVIGNKIVKRKAEAETRGSGLENNGVTEQ